MQILVAGADKQKVFTIPRRHKICDNGNRHEWEETSNGAFAMIVTSRCILVMLAFTFLALVSSLSKADSPSPAAIYPGWKAVASSNWNVKTAGVQNWRRMLARWSDGNACEGDTCTTAGWVEMVAQVRAAGGLLAQTKLANALINDPARHPYIEDINNWKQQDYWESPYELLKKSGDAEDFAIAKYFLLKAAGVPVADMQIITVRIKPPGSVDHVILAVRVESNTRTIILDNRVSPMLDATLLQEEFRPLLGINENAWWVFGERF